MVDGWSKRRWQLAAVVVSGAGQASAQTAPQRLQGKVVAVTADTVTIETANRMKIPVRLAPDWSLVISAKIGLGAIKPGSYRHNQC